MVQHTKKLARLFLDIETVAAPDVEDLIPEPKVDSRLKDPEKIKAARQEKIDTAVEMAALDPDLSRVALISLQIGNDGQPLIIVVPQGKDKAAKIKKQLAAAGVGFSAEVVKDEAEGLDLFWRKFVMCDGRTIGYNHISFDLPFLLRRSFDLGVKPPYMPNLSKYRAEPTTDLYCLMYNWDWQKSKGLKWVCKRYGIEVLEEDVDGSMVKDMGYVDLVKYGLSDLHATVGLYDRMNGYYFAF